LIPQLRKKEKPEENNNENENENENEKQKPQKAFEDVDTNPSCCLSTSFAFPFCGFVPLSPN
jgi:hypothetical protein